MAWCAVGADAAAGLASFHCFSGCLRSARRLELPLRGRAASVIAAVAARDCLAALEVALANWMASAVVC